MSIYYPDALEEKSVPRTVTYGDEDVMLYALGLGMGRDPMDERELQFVSRRISRLCPRSPPCWRTVGERPLGDARQQVLAFG
jgi:hypothetical protein